MAKKTANNEPPTPPSNPKIDLNKARGGVVPSSRRPTDDDLDKTILRRHEEYALEERAQKVKALKAENKDRSANRKMRFTYSRWVFYYLVGYSSVVALMLLMHGSNCMPNPFMVNLLDIGVGGGICHPFSLPDAVLSFLVGSTAASAIGLVAAVTTGLFPRNQR